MQEGILFHSLQDEATNEYIVQVSCTLHDLDTARWKTAWDSAIRLHEVLRAAFSWKKVKRAVQVIAGEAAPEWQEIDARTQACPFDLEAFLSADRDRGLELSRAPLMRMTLVRLGQNRYQFVWTYHHLILDGWSALIVMSDVLASYREPDALPKRKTPRFKDYTRWLERQDSQQARRYWTDLLREHAATSPAQLPAAAPEEISRIVKRKRLLDPALSRAAGDLVRRRQITMAQFMQAMWAVVLHRYCNRSEVIFGWVMSVRPRELDQATDMVGLMIATVPLRLRIDPGGTVGELYEQVALRSLEAAEHGHLPLAQIKQAAAVEPGQELFDSVMIFENLPTALKPAPQGDLVIEDRTTHWQTNYPLSLMVAPGPQLKLEFSFDMSRFSVEGIECVLTQLERLVRAAIDEPRSIQQLLDAASFNGSPHASARGAPAPLPPASIAQCIVRQATRQPARIAVMADSIQSGGLTYEELLHRSGLFACALDRAGIKAGDVVAIHLPRTPAVVVAMLGIMRLGAAFLPIAPDLPEARKQRMLSDGGARIAAAYQSPVPGFPIVMLDAGGEVCGARGEALDRVRPADTRVAYVMFTSGSTGVPKSVQIEETALANLLHAMARRPGFAADDVMLSITTVSFDISVLELLLPLVAGARLVIASEPMVRDGGMLAEAIDRFGVTVMQATPTTWRMLLACGWQGNPRLRAWCGGEALDRGLADHLLACTSALWNLYGPTETTIWTLVAQVERDGPIHLGTPISNVDCLVLDEWLRPVPAGVVGELYLAGACVAQGYVGNAAASAAAFLPHVAADRPGHRMYRTGDLARVDERGRIVCIGRRDTQVKLRGMRIDLAEIEALLCRHPAITAAAVTLSAIQGHDALVAYVVCRNELRESQMAAFLKPQLPACSVPSRFIRLDALPVSSNGKVDRKALPDSAAEGTPFAAAVASGNILVDIVGEIWCTVLGVSTFRREDNFFGLGGHSLKAISLMSAINRACSVSLPLATIFDHPAGGAFVEAIENALGARQVDEPVIPDVDLSAPHPASATQERLYYVTQIAPASHPYQLCVAVRFDASVDLAALGIAVHTLQARHAILRTVLAQEAQGLMQRVNEHPQVKLEVIDLQGAGAQEVAQRIRTEIQVPLFLDKSVAMRCIYLAETPERGTLLIVIHHVLVDEWSLNLLIEDLSKCYEAACANAAPRSDAGRPAFAQYAWFERQQQRTAEYGEALNYWTKTLSAIKPTSLSPRRPRPAVPSFRGGHHTISVAPATMTRLGALAAACSVTRFAMLMAALSVLLHRYHSENDICIGTMDAGRDSAWLAGIVGPLARPLVMRIPMKPEQSFRTLATNVQQVFLEAHRHRNVPFQHIAQRLERNDGISQLFRIMVVMQNMPTPPQRIGGIPIQATAVDSGTAETDLLIEMFDQQRGLTLRFTYDADLFDRVDLEIFGQRFLRLLETVANDADLPVASIDPHEGESQTLAHTFSEAWSTP